MQVQALKLSLLLSALLLGTSINIDAQQGTNTRYSSNDSLRAAHALNRLTFGARPGDLDLVLAMGVDLWIAQQLGAPKSISDSASIAFLSTIPNNPQALRGRQVFSVAAPSKVGNRSEQIITVNGQTVKIVMDSSRADQMKMADSTRRKIVLSPIIFVRSNVNDVVSIGRIARNETSEAQLLEVLTDFWHNHFSVFNGKAPGPDAVIRYDREVIRPNALGSFRQLLGAVAHSPMMMFYLDNHLSSADTSRRTLPEHSRIAAGGTLPRRAARPGLNENYARELLELHTLGVDAGYTQQDVIEVARAFTGWSLRRGGTNDSSTFLFAPERHDAEEKTVLGHTLAAGRGIQDGEDVLDILAKHPSTAKYIARKLVVRLVSDDPPADLVARAADTFLKTDGNIAEVVRTIVTSQEFFSPAAYRSKIRSPYEFVLAMKRALDANPDATIASASLLRELNMPPFGRETPEGWPETGSAWMSSGAMFKRVAVAMRVASGEVPSASPDSSPTWRALADAEFQQQLDAVVKVIFAGNVSSETRAVLQSVGALPPGETDKRSGRERLTELLTTAFSAPEFHRR